MCAVMNKECQIKFLSHANQLSEKTLCAVLIEIKDDNTWVITANATPDQMVILNHKMSRLIEKRFQALDAGQPTVEINLNKPKLVGEEP